MDNKVKIAMNLLPHKLHWMINRLRCMSVVEVFHRIRQLGITKAFKYGLLNTLMPKFNAPVNHEAMVTFDCTNTEGAAYLQEADAILAGRVILFAAKPFNVGSLPDWNRDPLTGIVAPLSFGPDIAISNRALVGDIKHVWELNRHLHWVRLAQAYLISADSRYLYGLAAQMSAWLEQCPRLTGVNWSSALELSIRLINWSLIWHMLGGWEGALFQHPSGERLRTRWLASIFAHCQFINWHFSRYSSANNHLIGELAGLYIAAKTWPYWSQSKQWALTSKAGLECEVLRQYSAEGVNKEQAFAYHIFTLEFLLSAGIVAQRNSDKFSDDFWRVVSKALGFLRSIRDVAGNIPQIGDADDGMVLRLEPHAANNRVAMILALGDAVFNNNTQVFTDTVKWLLGNGQYNQIAPIASTATDWQFPDAGYFVLGTDFGLPTEIKGLVDCGAVGYLAIAAHGHADALAVTLTVAGEACLVDSGTFSYGQALKWRDYFRGTSAHNTVRVDGVDQSVSGGRFMWMHKAKATVDHLPASAAQFDFLGHHDGYRRLADPVQHQRSVRFDADQRCLIIHDVVSGKVSHKVEQFWHFGATLTLALSGNHLYIKGQRFSAHMAFLGTDLQIQQFYGDEALPLGWMSNAYEVKQAISVIRVCVESDVAVIETHLTIDGFNDLF